MAMECKCVLSKNSKFLFSCLLLWIAGKNVSFMIKLPHHGNYPIRFGLGLWTIPYQFLWLLLVEKKKKKSLHIEESLVHIEVVYLVN